MVRIQNILCPVDFFPASENAARYAMSLADSYGATVHLLHVVTPVTPAAYDYPVNTADIMKALQEESAKGLARVAGFSKFAKVKVRTEAATGDVEKEILRYADKVKADMVALGTHGRRGFERFILGSVAERLLRQISCPILTIGSPQKLKALPTLKRIIITTDLSEGAAEAVDYGLSIAQESAATVTLLHVISDLVLADLTHPYRHALRLGIERQLESMIPEDARNWCSVRTLIESGTPYRAILSDATKDKADLIVMNIHGKSLLDRALLGSTAERVLRGAPCPVLAIPPKKGARGKAR